MSTPTFVGHRWHVLLFCVVKKKTCMREQFVVLFSGSRYTTFSGVRFELVEFVVLFSGSRYATFSGVRFKLVEGICHCSK